MFSNNKKKCRFISQRMKIWGSVSAIWRVGALLVAFIGMLLSCGPFVDSRTDAEIDLVPPVFMGAKTISPQEIELEFSEEVSLEAGSLMISPELELYESYSLGNSIRLKVTEEEPGREYQVEAIVADVHGNTSNLIVGFYGFNGHIPALLINEFITNGSATHPDLVEIKVMSGGNMAGVAVYAGVKDNFDSRLIFPSFAVVRGDFILVHFKPEGIAGEVNETTAKDQSGGLDASSSAFDFWVKDGNGLSGNNGTISIYSSPTGSIIDGVLYSDRTRTSDTLYMGFGTEKTMKRAQTLVSDLGWKAALQDIAPEDGVNPDTSTATRSICRDRQGTDTDTKSDWHIVPSRKSSFGYENCEEVYVQ